jgi:subtilisin
MNAKPDEGVGTEESARTASTRGGEATMSRGSGRKAVSSRTSQYMIAPADRNTTAILVQRLRNFGVAEVARTLEPRGDMCPPVAIVHMSAENAASLRASARGMLIVEADAPLQAAAASGTPASVCAAATAAVAVPFGPGFTTTIQVLSESAEPVERALVELVGQRWIAQGVTDGAGMVTLTLIGELPEQVTELLVKPRRGFWNLRQANPKLQIDGVNAVTLRPLTQAGEFGWGGRAMRFDQLPSDYRGGGIKIALIDSGVATGHWQLGTVKHGFDAPRGEERRWSQDAAGHGTPCAGILVAAAGKPDSLRGYAPDAELHVCKLAPDASCSDLISALDYCIEAKVDIACVGFASGRGSTIVEQRVAAAKQLGTATIAAAGSTGGPVQFPACSPHVLAVGAIGHAGTFPENSLEAALAEAGNDWSIMSAGSGLFVPAFSCTGPEIDLCGPGVAVISCQSPDGHAACDGTSLAAPHVAALAALVLAHRSEFRYDFVGRDARRVERLFGILKETALQLGSPWQTGAGLPDAPRALRIQPERSPFAAPLSIGLLDLRNAMRLAGLTDVRKTEDFFPQPLRGPAVVDHLPFNLGQPAVPSVSVGAHIRELRGAMRLAGLAADP